MRIFGELIAVTKTTNKSRRGDKSGLIFHVKIGNHICQYYVTKVNSGTLNLLCACRKCTSAMSIECSFLKFFKTTPAGRKIYEIDPSFSEEELFNVEIWGPVNHKCGRFYARSCKINHIPDCTMVSSSLQATKRIMTEDLKSRFENDKVTEPKNLVSDLLRDYVPSGKNVPADYMFTNNINERQLRQVVYSLKKKTKSNTGVPQDLLDFCTTTDENGDKKYERFIYEKPTFICFILPSDLRIFSNSVVFCDGTFDAVARLNFGPSGSAQLYNFVIKWEVGNRTFTYVVAQFLMKYRTREIYIQILEFLKELFTQFFPEDPPFNPPAFHSDYEAAFVSAVSHCFPTSVLQFCSFHWSQTMHRRLSIVRSKPTEDPILSEIWTLLKAVPYIPWSASTRDEFFRILDAKQELLEPNLQENFSAFVAYLFRTYFNVGQFSFLVNQNYDYFGDFGQNDLSNNSAETRNFSINSLFTTGRKTLNSFCQTLVKFKKNHYSERLFALRGNDNKYLRKRSPQQQKRFEDRRSKSLFFARLSEDEQISSLYTVLLDLGQYGPSAQSL